MCIRVIIAAIVCASFAAFAQTPDVPRFEVASIKPGDPTPSRVFTGMQRGGRFVASNASLKLLIEFAYDLRSYQVAGGPNWVDTANFTIEAIPDSQVPIPSGQAGILELRPMVQNLLADRFKLAVHREMKDQQVYDLVLAKGGSKLKEAPPGRPGQPMGIRSQAPGRLTGTSETMSILARVLSERLGRLVIDKTGLAETRYDFILSWTPDPEQPATTAPAGNPADSADASGPTIFTALQEQLGLKLESTKRPVEMLIIDRVERPDEN